MLMRKMLSAATAAALVVVGCNENKSDTTPTTTNAPAPVTPNEPGKAVTNTGGTMTNPVVTDPIAAATNKASVKRLGDEEKLASTPERIVASQVILRDAPRGTSLGMAKAGDLVTEVARSHGYYLVLMPDADDKDKQMAAWIYKDAFVNPSTISAKGDTTANANTTANAKSKTATSATGEKLLPCKKGETSMRSDREFCAKECKGDGDCGAGNVCDGAAVAIKTNGKDAEVKYCIGETTSATVTPGSPNNAVNPNVPVTPTHNPTNGTTPARGSTTPATTPTK